MDSTSSTESQSSPEEKFFGPYLSERQWGTVREDYSSNGDCWKFCTHEQSHSKVYLHGEDGLFGWSDHKARLCASVALWNGKDKVLKERLFGLSGPQGNHGEDVKELYYYLNNVPDHSYMKALYRYPQSIFPYNKLIKKNKSRCFREPEFELIDTGVFDYGYWDVYMEFAKENEKTCLCRYTIHNRGKEQASLYVLPQIWLRDTWSHYSCDKCHTPLKPSMTTGKSKDEVNINYSEGSFVAKFDSAPDGRTPVILFTENDANNEARNEARKETRPEAKKTKTEEKYEKPCYTKNAFHRYLIERECSSVNTEKGTKCAAVYCMTIPPGGSKQVQMCLWPQDTLTKCSKFKDEFENILRIKEKNAKNFYTKLLTPSLNEEEKNIVTQAYAGLLWSKQFYCYDVGKWLVSPAPQSSDDSKNKEESDAWSMAKRNQDWLFHLHNCDIISMPDKWEFPWYAAWDLAFHMIPYSFLDPQFTKKQLLLLLSDDYLHPSGQLPAYEFNFSDTNPPVHCWACLHVYRNTGAKDTSFLKKCFNRLLLNYNWWTNMKKIPGPGHLYSGGFLGMDNISVYDRSHGIPPGYFLAQADGTGWMAFFALKMFEIAVELSKTDPDYLDMAQRFFKHFLLIAESGSSPISQAGFWDEEDGFFYDILLPKQSADIIPLCIRSLVGLVPLIACSLIDISSIVENNSEFLQVLKQASIYNSSKVKINNNKMFVSFVSKQQLQKILKCMLSESEFLSPFGIRSLSKHYEKNPYPPPVEINSGHKLNNGKSKSPEGQHRKEEEANKDNSTKKTDENKKATEEKKSKEENRNNGAKGNGSGNGKRDAGKNKNGSGVEKKSLADDESDGCDDGERKIRESEKEVDLIYAPGESTCGMFGGNSNWRGPIWLCMNFLLQECLETYYGAYGDEYNVEFPTGSKIHINLHEVATAISMRIVSLFLPDKDGCRPLHGDIEQYTQENWHHLVLFYEFFHAETGRGCGASHHTGWSALVVEFLKKLHSSNPL